MAALSVIVDLVRGETSSYSRIRVTARDHLERGPQLCATDIAVIMNADLPASCQLPATRHMLGRG